MTHEPITRRIIRPANCVLGFGIPLSRPAFERTREDEAEDRFAKRYELFSTYRHEVVRPYEMLEPRLRKLGVRSETELSLPRFSALFLEPDVHVVILFSHWGRDAVEFQDGLAAVPGVVAAVPESFTGFLDLCVCHPEPLIPALRLSRPSCVFNFIRAEATPVFWLYFYWALFRLLHSRPSNYLAALDELLITWLRQEAPGSGVQP